MAMMKNQRKKKDLPITGFMAKWYDKNTRASRLKEMRGYAEIIAGYLPAGSTVLEVAPGPGYLSIELAKRGYHVTGVELSADFVEIEKRNAAVENAAVDFRQGNASALPLADETADFVVCSAAFKNFMEPLKAMQEMYRVLKPGGTALILDMNRDSTKEDINEEIKSSGMKGFDRLFVKFSFKTFLKHGAYTKSEFEQFISQTDFNRNEIIKHGIGFQVWMYK